MFRRQKISFYTFPLLIFLFTILIINACKSLPGGPGTADNPFDPDNPDNSFNGTALVLSPAVLSVSSGTQFTIDLWIVGADSIAGFNVKIEFDPDELQLEKIDFLETDSESLLLENGGELINFENTDSTSGYTILDCAVVEGSPANVTGTGILARITFEHLSGSQTDLDINTAVKFRNNYNEPVSIDTFIGSEITIK